MVVVHITHMHSTAIIRIDEVACDNVLLVLIVSMAFGGNHDNHAYQPSKTSADLRVQEKAMLGSAITLVVFLDRTTLLLQSCARLCAGDSSQTRRICICCVSRLFIAATRSVVFYQHAADIGTNLSQLGPCNKQWSQTPRPRCLCTSRPGRRA